MMTDKTYTGADDFLRSVREARIERRRCEYRLEELRAQCERITPGYSGMPGGGGDAHRDALLLAAAEQADELTRRIEAHWLRIRDVEDFILTIPDARLRTVLRLRYVDALPWGGVASGMREYGLYYAERQVYNLHGAALAEARAKWPEWVREHPELSKSEGDDGDEREVL